MPKGKVSPERKAQKSARFFPQFFHFCAPARELPCEKTSTPLWPKAHHGDTAFSPEERAMLHNILRLARTAGRGCHDPALPILRPWRFPQRSATCWRCSKSQAIRACRFLRKRSMIRAAWCTSAMSSITSPRFRGSKPPRKIRCPRAEGACCCKVQPFQCRSHQDDCQN